MRYTSSTFVSLGTYTWKTLFFHEAKSSVGIRLHTLLCWTRCCQTMTLPLVCQIPCVSAIRKAHLLAFGKFVWRENCPYRTPPIDKRSCVTFSRSTSISMSLFGGAFSGASRGRIITREGETEACLHEAYQALDIRQAQKFSHFDGSGRAIVFAPAEARASHRADGGSSWKMQRNTLVRALWTLLAWVLRETSSRSVMCSARVLVGPGAVRAAYRNPSKA